jgi:DNA-directed RNA polymerase subunit alpha
MIHLDAAFSPVARVRCTTEDTRVGQKTNFDRLVLEIWTNGVVTPDMALVEAAKILRKHLNPIVQFETEGAERTPAAFLDDGEGVPALGEQGDLAEKLARPVADLNLSARAGNCLQAKGIVTVNDLVRMGEDDLLKVENLGRTTLGEIKRRLAEWGLGLGLDIPETVGKVGA